MQCDMTVSRRGLVGQCRRSAAFLYLRSAGPRRWATVNGYCRQHHETDRGPARLLRPFAWEFDRIVQVDASESVIDVAYDRLGETA